MSRKALIAMSGGVDSSVAALLMKEKGYDCIGVTMKLHDNRDNGLASEKSCCTSDDIADAGRVAERLGIPFYVVDYKADFKEKVMDPFVEAYLRGCTPNPCIECNRHLKFEHLYRKAEELGCDVIATGHYACVDHDGTQYCLKRAADPAKDQSYVLYSLTQEQLSHTMFPLGALKKEQVRELARKHDLINAAKRESQDICFIPDGDYKRFMREHYHINIGDGEFVDRTGKVLGKHSGYYGFTIGQRRGLGIAAEAPYYVVDILPERNQVVLGGNEDLYQTTLVAEHVNWLMSSDYKDMIIQAKVRYRQAAQNVYVKRLEGDRIQVEFLEPQRAITRGQAVVLYCGDIVIGGGTISALTTDRA